MNENNLIDYLEQQIQLFYHELKEFGDVAPAKRMRLEGQCQLLLDMNYLSWSQLKDIIEPLCFFNDKEDVIKEFWQWSEQQNICRLPCQATIAPVN